MVAGDETGVIEFVGKSPDGREVPLQTFHTTQTANNATDLTKWPFASSSVSVRPGSQIQIYFTSDATDTLDSTDHTWLIPVVLRNQATGSQKQLILTKDDFNAGDVNTKHADKVLTAAQRILIGEYTVPDGVKARLGDGGLSMTMKDDTA